MEYRVLRPFCWNGRMLGKGDTVDIPADHARIGSLVRARFMRFAAGMAPVMVSPQALPPSDIADNETAPAPPAGTKVRPTPKQVVAEAKARAYSKQKEGGMKS